MDTTHRIKVKIGPAEFEAEGDPELVKQQFAEFMAAVSAIPQAQPDKPPGLPPRNDPGASLISKDIFDRVFRRDDGISLLAMPRTDNAEADALIVLLYGFLKLENQRAITGVALMSAAKQSGINVDRIDRTINARPDLIQAAGNKRGRRYSLNNRGIAEAERLLREMVE